MSLGGGESTTLQQAVRGAWENGGANGSVLVAAAGNDGDSTGDVEVAAPGVDILSTIPGGQYA